MRVKHSKRDPLFAKSFLQAIIFLCLVAESFSQCIPNSPNSPFVGKLISTLKCNQILLTQTPFAPLWNGSPSTSSLLDKSGAGTGFTMYLPGQNAYAASDIFVQGGSLILTARKVVLDGSSNVVSNVLGIGLDLPQTSLTISINVDIPTNLTMKNELAGLWFGQNADNYITNVIVALPGGLAVQTKMEESGSVISQTSIFNVPPSIPSISLKIDVDPSTSSITTSYATQGIYITAKKYTKLKGTWFNFAQIDDNVGTNCFAGIMGSTGDNVNTLNYKFSKFTVIDPDALAPTPSQSISFTPSNSISIPPSSLSPLNSASPSTSSSPQSGCYPAIPFNGKFISPLPCNQVKVNLPFGLDWHQSNLFGILDKNGVGTGLTMVDPSQSNPYLDPSKLTVNTSDGTLNIETGPGIFTDTVTTQVNALGVGVEFQNFDPIEFHVQIIDAPPGSQYEQAGLLFFHDQGNNFIKFVIISPSNTTRRLQVLYVKERVVVQTINFGFTARTVFLQLVADPVFHTCVAYGNGIKIGTISNISDTMFNNDPTAIDPTLGTASFMGLFATHRFRTSGSQIFKLQNFGISRAPRPFTLSPTPSFPSVSSVPFSSSVFATDFTQSSSTSSFPFTTDSSIFFSPSVSPIISPSLSPSVSGFDNNTGCTPFPSQFPGKWISTLPCTSIKVFEPFVINWNGTDQGGMVDHNNAGLGTTMVLPSSTVPNYFDPLKLTVTSTGLLFTTDSTGQKNRIGVGLNLPNSALTFCSYIKIIPPLSGSGEAAGIYFAMSDTNIVLLQIVSTSLGVLQARTQLIVDGSVVHSVSIPFTGISSNLCLLIDPNTVTVTAQANNQNITTFTDVPLIMFSFDAAGIDFNVATRSFGGLAVTPGTRLASLGDVTFVFGNFSVLDTFPAPPVVVPQNASIDFTWWSFPYVNPTAMVNGPDGRLYVVNAKGLLSAFVIDHLNRVVVSSQVIMNLNSLTLGMVVDPNSTPTSITIWCSISDIKQSAAAANTGGVSKIVGPTPNWVRTDVIIGLPRSYSNHATNGLQFDRNGLLYIMQSGNSGAGAANDGNSEFKSRPEQYLSAAILTADVKNPTFNGNCMPTIDPSGTQLDATGIAPHTPPTCDVKIHSTGVRNSYAGWWHSVFDRLYFTDNGLGVEGTFPVLKPDPLHWVRSTGCDGFIQGAAAIAANNPGARADLLMIAKKDAHYGHPNPTRNQCVYYGGNPTNKTMNNIPQTGKTTYSMSTTQYPVGVNPDPNFILPIFSFGAHKSADGITEFNSNAFCGVMKGDLLVTYYSSSDQVHRLTLSSDGNQIASEDTLIRTTIATGGPGLLDPLPIIHDSTGAIFVGEFTPGKVTVFEPIINCWQIKIPTLPIPIGDAGGAATATSMFVVGGKNNAGHSSAVYKFDTIKNAWSQLPNLPSFYIAVENPATAVVGENLYVFGGAPAPFAGAVNTAAVFTSSTQTWSQLPNLPTARAGAYTAVINSVIYVVGGMDAAGKSLSIVEAFDTISKSWSTLPLMLTPRDNPGVGVISGNLFVCGGRNRGTADVLNSCEMYNFSTKTWSSRASMPTGRRSLCLGVIENIAVAIGGEFTGGIFGNVERYDPSTDKWSVLPNEPLARHGVACAVCDRGLFMAGGFSSKGYTNYIDVYRFRK